MSEFFAFAPVTFGGLTGKLLKEKFSGAGLDGALETGSGVNVTSGPNNCRLIFGFIAFSRRFPPPPPAAPSIGVPNLLLAGVSPHLATVIALLPDG